MTFERARRTEIRAGPPNLLLQMIGKQSNLTISLVLRIKSY
jgi:hypothetical protein